MGNSEIIKMILEESDFDSKIKLAELVGYEKLEQIVTRMRASGEKIPHVMDDVMGALRGNEEMKLAKLLEESTPEQVEVLVKAFGSQKCKRASKLIENPAKAHLVIDFATPMSYKESEAFIAEIEKTGVSDYRLAQKMVMIHGFEKTENDIKATKYFRPVKHIVDDVIGPLKSRNKESLL